MLLLATKTG